MKNVNLTIMGGIMFCTGVGMMIVGVFRYLDNEIVEMPSSFDIAHDTRYDFTLGNIILALALVVLGLFLMSTLKVTKPGNRNSDHQSGE